MKIFFMGVTKLGLKCLRLIQSMGFEIAGCAYTEAVIKAKRQPSGVPISNFADMKAVAEAGGIPAVFFDKSDPAPFEEAVRALRPDLIVVAGWYYIVGPGLLSIPPLGAIGLHSSMLPRYRGCSPLSWQIINGEKSAGISLFYLADGVDSGDIIGQIAFPIGEEDTIATMIDKAENAGLNLLTQYLPLLANGTAPRIKQDEANATHFKQRIPADGEIDWAKTPEQIRNFIRAQTRPYQGAFTYICGKKITIWDADVINIDSELL